MRMFYVHVSVNTRSSAHILLYISVHEKYGMGQDLLLNERSFNVQKKILVSKSLKGKTLDSSL